MANTMGQRIRERRKELGFTQEKLASKLGVTYQAVSKWESGTSMPDIALISPLAMSLQTSAEELLTGAKSTGADTVLAPGAKRRSWGDIKGIVAKDIHGDVRSIIGEVHGDVYGNVTGNITGSVNNIFGNVEGNITGTVDGDITGYVAGSLFGIVTGSVRLGIRGRVNGTVVGDGINIPDDKTLARIQKKLDRDA
ncbi:MAG: helix-turn-helix domain-containing protein [Coriobacteriia bacterium]|nr:helix-turn-helix domain-containing protein [Coriobacteriia bacterium]